MNDFQNKTLKGGPSSTLYLLFSLDGEGDEMEEMAPQPPQSSPHRPHLWGISPWTTTLVGSQESPGLGLGLEVE